MRGAGWRSESWSLVLSVFQLKARVDRKNARGILSVPKGLFVLYKTKLKCYVVGQNFLGPAKRVQRSSTRGGELPKHCVNTNGSQHLSICWSCHYISDVSEAVTMLQVIILKNV